jgi:hypothetical protein
MVADDATGVLRQMLPLDVLTWLVLGWLGFGLRRRLARRQPVEISLAVGGAIGLAAFFLIAGSGGIAANVERYSLWVIGPAALLAALACDTWFDGSRRRWAAIGGISLAWLLLFTFQCDYFECFNRTGGDGHRTYRTEPIEPKQAAFDYIAAHAPSGKFTRVLTSEWWNYWPLRYLSLATGRDASPSGSPPLNQIIIERWDASGGIDGLVGNKGRSLGRLFFVEFTASDAATAIRRWASGNDVAIQEILLNDAADRPVLSVFAVEVPAGRAAVARGPATRGPDRSHASSEKVYEIIKVVDLTNPPTELRFHSNGGDQSDP